MDSLFVISSEPALGETLTSLLPDFTITQAKPEGTKLAFSGPSPRLVILDTTEPNPFEGQDIPFVTIKRPVRLRDLLYTIHAQLQSKTASEELALTSQYRFLPNERLLRATSLSDITLTEKEVELLLCLMQNGETAIGRDALLKQVWGYSDDVTTHTLETHIYRLRGKLHQADEALDITFSENGGYQLIKS